MKNKARQELDRICRTETAFADFEALLNAKGSYRPSCDVSNRNMEILADGFDSHMMSHGDDRRAYRYGRTGLDLRNKGRQDVVEAIKQAKSEARREDGDGKVVCSGSWQLDASDKDGNRLEAHYDEGEGTPSLKQLRAMANKPGVASVWIQGDTYFLDATLSLAEQWEHRENTGEGWAVEVHCGN